MGHTCGNNNTRVYHIQILYPVCFSLDKNIIDIFLSIFQIKTEVTETLNSTRINVSHEKGKTMMGVETSHLHNVK